MDKLVQQEAPELERRLTELQSQINRLSLSLHLWQERQDRLFEQRVTDWNAIEARAQKDASVRMRELQTTIEQEWNELRQLQPATNQHLQDLGSNLSQKITDLADRVQAVVSELRSSGALRSQSLQPPTPSWPLDDVVRLHNQLRDSDANRTNDVDQSLAKRTSLILPEAPPELLERLETLERAVNENPLENARSVGTAWRAVVVLLAISVGIAGVIVSRLQGQMNAATARVSQAEQQAQAATKSANEQIAAARQEASQQIAQAKEAAERAQTAVDVQTAPDVRHYNLVGGDTMTSLRAQALWSPSRGALVFNGSQLPAVGNGSTYQLWLLSGVVPTSVATFVPDAGGRVSVTTRPPQVPTTVTGVLVTLERSGGSATPSAQVVLRRPPPPPVDTP